ncbi:hypothetical protein ACFXDJ_15670 [Streptomyces sp. NPDC059443]|uniref:hypothetical protein n=1 Tax=unclassified Streptomyces TaxID=2593676 RepID=UPI0036BAAA5C
MNEPSSFFLLAAWMTNAPAAHPLRAMFDITLDSDAPSSCLPSILGAVDSMIGTRSMSSSPSDERRLQRLG